MKNDGIFGFLTPAIRSFFRSMKWLSPMQWLSSVNSNFRSRSELTAEDVASREFNDRRARDIEKYVLIWLLLEPAIVAISSAGQWSLVPRLLIIAIVSLRIIEIVQVTVNVMLFDFMGDKDYRGVGTISRVLVLAGINFVELLLCFGVIYALNYQSLMGAGQPVTGFYFSIITQLTIGYGDVYPTRWLRLVAAVQGLTGALFIILVFGRIIASLQPIKAIYDDRAGTSSNVNHPSTTAKAQFSDL